MWFALVPRGPVYTTLTLTRSLHGVLDLTLAATDARPNLAGRRFPNVESNETGEHHRLRSRLMNSTMNRSNEQVEQAKKSGTRKRRIDPRMKVPSARTIRSNDSGQIARAQFRAHTP